ncbi:PspC domain-containing protein [Gemmatimonadota bacterium]
MENGEMKKCPYCAENIRAEAVKCRYCGSNLVRRGPSLDFLQTPGYWHRVNEGKKIAGVCTGLARQFDSPILILPLRVFFIVTTLFYGFGLWSYLIFWLLMPAPLDSAEVPSSPAVETPPDQYRRAAPAVDQYPGQPAAPQSPAPPTAAPDSDAPGPEEAQAEEEPAPEPEEEPAKEEEVVTDEEKWGPKSKKKGSAKSGEEDKKDLENF